MRRRAAAENASGAPGRTPVPPASSVMSGIRRQDSAALGTFFDHYIDFIYGLAYRFLGHRRRAEDATREILWRIRLEAHSLDPKQDPLLWIVSAILTICTSLSTPPSSSSTAEESNTAEVLVGECAAPPGSGTGLKNGPLTERECRLQRAIASLSEPLRIVLVLCSYQGFQYRTIAELMGVTPEAVRSLHSEALSELRRRLEIRPNER